MSENKIEKVKCLIIGSGPAGYTAAIYAARADMKPVLYKGLQEGGQLTETTDVDNFPGYPNGINGTQMMIDLENQAKRFDTDVRSGIIQKVDFSDKIHKCWTDKGDEIHAESVIISTGASANWLGLESETKFRNMGAGVSACATCDGFFYRGKDVAVVGGGDSACEEASYLSKLCNKVYMIVRKDHFKASKALQNRINKLENIEILYNSVTKEILGNDGVDAVRVTNLLTNEEKDYPIHGFFVAIGHKPNTDFIKEYIELDEEGFVKKISGSTKTNVAGVFVAGDAGDKVYKQAITAAGSGCMAALDAEKYLAMNE